MNTEENKIIISLINCIESAIEIGDWKVDGRCDPEMPLEYAKQHLRNAGYTEDSFTKSEWFAQWV